MSREQEPAQRGCDRRRPQAANTHCKTSDAIEEAAA